MMVSVGGHTAAGDDDSVVATFEGKPLRLADGWGEATACFVDEAGTRCYRSEAEMDGAESAAPSAIEAECGSSVRIYSGTGHTGSSLAFTTRLVLINLAGYGFNNVTSSYKIGTCAARFYDTTTGTTLYPGNTGAGASSGTMASGWDNRVGSLWIL